jgi:hypothetical protein
VSGLQGIERRLVWKSAIGKGKSSGVRHNHWNTDKETEDKK